jgi:SMODS and SLOG-associating 2TM effector domain 3/SMODS and SLOG-associating 2TM effector domain 1
MAVGLGAIVQGRRTMNTEAFLTMVELEQHLPTLFRSAEDVSTGGRRRFERLTGSMLVLLVIAAAGGLVEQPWGGWVSAAAFAVSVLIPLLWVYDKARTAWYDGRAGAESVKSISWKYAVGGEPFGVDRPRAEALYFDTLQALVAEFGRLSSEVAGPATAPDVAALSDVRQASLEERRSLYRDRRLAEQRAWYVRRAGEHRAVAGRYGWAVVVVQVLGVAGAVLKGIDVVDLDLLAVPATIAAALTAWIAVGDHRHVARTYDFAVLELETVLGREASVADEASWAVFVADAEAAMGREHGMWLARRRAV